jgi:hypothetical protein
MRLRATLLTTCLGVALSAPAWAGSVTPGQATPVQREQAQSRFQRGKDLYAAKKYDEALVEFRGSSDIVASPNARLYEARCLRELGRLVEAYVEFGRASVEAREHLVEDPRYAKTAEAAAAERDAIAPQIGFVNVHVERADETSRLKVGSDEIRRGGWSEPIPVKPGQTEIVLETPSKKPLRQTVTVAAGEKKAVSFDAGSAEPEAPAPTVTEPTVAVDTSAKSDRTKLRPWAFVAGGVGAAGLVTFAIFGAMSSSTFDDLKSACGNGPCPANRQNDIDKGRTQQTVANVGLVIGVLGVAAGATLFVLSIPPKEKKTEARAALVVGPQWLGVEGTFR